MSLNQTASGERIHIAFFGMRNAGKSSIVNAVTGLDLSIVSDVKGTTTDPVKRAMELLPLGPVVIIDTPGLDDEGELGQKRVEKTKLILAQTEIAVLVVDSTLGLGALDRQIIQDFEARKLPYLVVFNKWDSVNQNALSNKLRTSLELLKEKAIKASAKTGEGISKLKEALAAFGKSFKQEKHLVSDLIPTKSRVILVIPIDESAPKGRLIMPQQMAIRDLLDHHCIPICCQVEELANIIDSLREKPNLVITDSQAFEQVSKIVSVDINLTSFSILMARYKGDLDSLLNGAATIKALKDGDKVLIAEGCVHHRQCNDIGTKKLPAWLEAYSKAKPEYTFVSGGDFPSDLTKFKLIVHCGGCMLNEAEMKHRLNLAEGQAIPIVNYGMAIAAMNGILDRATKILKTK